MKKYETAGKIQGCKVARQALAMSHRFFADNAYLFFQLSSTEGATMKNVLDIYEAASEQTINYNKSNLTFNTNVKDHTRAEVCNIFRIQANQNQCKYLGLPTLVGRRKKEILNFVKDRVWQRMQGWRNKNLS